jgi:hypothetical protein
VQIDEWTPGHATATLPQLAVTSPVAAEIVLVTAEGFAASKVKIELIPAKDAAGDAANAVAALTR